MATLIWLAQGGAAAAEMISDTVVLEPVVVTATGTEVPLKDSTQSVTVITEKQIEERQAVRVEEMLRYTPGVRCSLMAFASTMPGVILISTP